MKFFKQIKYFILFFLLQSCFSPEYIYLSDEFKSFVIHPVGSYWVYVEKESGLRDSIYVSSLSYDFYSKAESGLKQETINIDYKSTKKNFRAQAIAENYFESKCNSFSILYTFERTFRFYCCCDTGKIHERYYYDEYLNSMTVQNNNFVNVRCFVFSDFSDTTSMIDYIEMPTKIYYGKDVGIIKWEQFNGEIWELEKFLIKK